MRRVFLIAVFLSCGKTSRPPAAGSSGAFGIVTVDGKQKMYLPLSTPQLAVVDVGVKGNGTAGTPAQIKLIDLGSTSPADSSGGDDTVVIAASTGVATIWFIDPHTDTLVKTLPLSLTDVTPHFSGGGGYVTGVAVDSAHRRAILSVWNGFAIVDLDKKDVVKTIIAAPAENFGYDSTSQRIIAPFYGCPSATLDACNQYKTPTGNIITDGFNVIDLADDTVYTYQDPAAASPTAPLGPSPDAAAVDPSSGLVLVPSENTNDSATALLDLGHASFDKTKKTVTASHHTIAISLPDYMGVAIEPSRHLAFWEEEFGSGIAVADLTQENQGKSTLVLGQMPSAPGNAGWSNIGDPHGIAVTAGIADGKSVGFLVGTIAGERAWVARVDLQAMLAAPHPSGALGPGEMAAFVTFLDPRTKP